MDLVWLRELGVPRYRDALTKERSARENVRGGFRYIESPRSRLTSSFLLHRTVATVSRNWVAGPRVKITAAVMPSTG